MTYSKVEKLKDTNWVYIHQTSIKNDIHTSDILIKYEILAELFLGPHAINPRLLVVVVELPS
jgi:hypothetical protein